MTITPELLGRLTQRGPRYTSYPTAAQFHEGVGPLEVRASMLADGEAAARPVSLYFHVLYCEKLCWYCACHKEISRDPKTSPHYTMQLCDELDLRARLLDLGSDDVVPARRVAVELAQGRVPAQGRVLVLRKRERTAGW